MASSSTTKCEGRVRDGKRKAEADDDEVQSKVQRHEGSNETTRIALKEERETKQEKSTKLKLDVVLSNSYPNATVHEDYACVLNQTKIDNNTNKFYVIQVVKDEEYYLVLTRWGRVGESGQKNADRFSKVEDATKAFEKIFKDKTKNKWADRGNFVTVSKKYTLLDMDEDIETEDDDTVSVEPPFQQGVLQMPLGKLSKAQVTRGLETLSEIEDAIKKKKHQETLSELSSKFYTLVPHKFGRKSAPPVIDSDVLLEKMKKLCDIELEQRKRTGQN